MSVKPETIIDPWYYTTWAGQEEEKLARSLAATYEERFRWLCETFNFMAALAEGDKKNG